MMILNRQSQRPPIMTKSIFVLFCLAISPLAFALDISKIDFSPDEFGVLQRRLLYNPDDLKVGDQLRALCVREDKIDQCIDALNQLTEKHPDNKSLRYQAALAYVDAVPGKTLFRQGWLSTRSMKHVSRVIEADPEDWPAYYIRGLNAVYWPTSFHKLSGAIADLKRCLEISGAMPAGLRRPYHALAFIALGDAYVKADEISAARATYQQGAELFDSNILRSRVVMSDQQLIDWVRDFRNTDSRVDTEISFLSSGGKEKI